MKYLILAVSALLSLDSFAAQSCNASGADPTDCKSANGEYEILIDANRNVTGVGLGTTGFCKRGYVKINGIEVNGALGVDVPEDNLGVIYVDSVTTENGVNAMNAETHGPQLVSTAIGFSLSDKVRAQLGGIDNGEVLVFMNRKDATMLLSKGDQFAQKVVLSCQ